MNKNAWITVVVVAIVFAGGGFYGGMKYQASKTPSLGGAGGTFVTRTGGAGAAGRFGSGAAGGGFTTGTILSVGSGTMTVQLAQATTSGATTGTKIVLIDNSTQITALQTVSASSLQVGQNVTVTGTTNSDGSITATSIMARTAGAGGFTGQRGTAPTGSGQ